MADLGKKTLDELQTEFVELGDQLSVLVETRRAYADEIANRVAAAAVKARISGMNGEELGALRIAIDKTEAGVALKAMS